MSCPHGNPIGGCDICDEVDAAFEAGKRSALAEQPSQQEPVAIVSGYYGGQCVILPIDPARIFNSNTPLYTSPQAQRKPLMEEQLDKAGMKLAECMDYPWEHMPEEGKRNMRDHAKAIIEAAHGIKE